MVTMVTVGVRCAALAMCALGCGARLHAASAAAASDEVTLYRDRALVKQRVDVVMPSAGATKVTVKVAAGVGPGDLVILDRGALVVSDLRIENAAPGNPDPIARAVPSRPSEDPPEAPERPESHAEAPGPARATASSTPTELEIGVAAPRAGRFAMYLAYATDRLAWDAAYTMTTTGARDRAVLRGALAIRNTSGIALHAHTYVVDAELGAWRDHAADQLGSVLAGMAPSTSELPHPCDLGVIPLGDGETRVALLVGDPPRKIRSVLVYDPIGTRLDHPGSSPISDPAFGVETAAPTRVTESFEIEREIEREERAPRALPAGPVRLYERHPDGSLAVLGESRMFDVATQVAGVDTVAIGTAGGVVGHRERRDWAKDDDQKRFSEEFLVTIDNARPGPVEIVLREHLYRGQNWTLAYQSAVAAKEGPQQIALRTSVPANGRAQVLYVVVYTW
jgi:hypothetical protein